MVVAGAMGAILIAAAPALGGLQSTQFARNADKVDGFHANHIARAAGAGVADYPSHVGNGIIVQTKIRAPRAGYLLITANADAYNPSTYVYPVGYIAVNGSIVPWSVMYIDLYDTTEADLATSAMGSVYPGTYTVTLAVDNADSYTMFAASNLQVQFVPFGPNGGTAMPGGSVQQLITPDAPRLGAALPDRMPPDGAAGKSGNPGDKT